MNAKIPRRIFEQRLTRRNAETSIDMAGETKCGPPEPGDIYLAPSRQAAIVDWAVIQPHPDNASLLYFVPVDDHPLVGAGDVVVPRRTAGSRLVLRCGDGLWAQSDHFDVRLWTGRIGQEYVQAARQTLAKMVRGSLAISAARLENEADPEYDDWMREVSVARQALEQWLEDAGYVVPLSEFRDNGPAVGTDQLSLVAESDHPYVLAAESGGLLGAIAEALEEAEGAPPRFRRLSGDWSGDLYLRADDVGVAALWQPSEGEPPAVRVRAVNRRWRQGEENLQTTNTFCWQEGEVTIRIGTEPGQVLIIQQ
jgi:hypothetical protein